MAEQAGIVVASNLGFGVDERVRAMPAVREVISLPPFGPWSLPPEADFLIYLRRGQDGEGDVPRPPGWPGRLRGVQCAAAGLDGFPQWLFEVGPVACARGTNSRAIGEYVLAALLSLEKRIPTIWQDGTRAWPSLAEAASQPLGTLEGKTLGLVGWGSIARCVAAMAAPFGMRLVACRREAKPEPGIEIASLEQVLAQSDYVVLALPLTAQSHHLLDAERIALMKRSAHLINVSRGPLIDHVALEEALREGRLAGATLDVTEPEPLRPGASLYRAPGIRVSAHVSFASPYTLANVTSKVVENVERFARGEPMLDVVDPTLRY